MSENRDLQSGAFPLSMSQMNIWRLEKTYKNTPQNNICCILDVGGTVDLSLLKAAFLETLKTAPALRTRIFERDGQPFQYLTEEMPADVPAFDFSTSREGVDKWADAVASAPMRLVEAPLYYAAIFRSSPLRGGVLFCAHHLISDAWTQGLIMQSVADNYMRLLDGRAPDDAQGPSYRAHVEDERAYLASERFAQDEKFWREKLAGIHSDARAQTGMSNTGARLSFKLPPLLARLTQAFCGSRRVSPFLLFLAALLIYERRVLGEETPCIGVPVLGRRTADEKRAVGMFVQTLPLCAQVPLDAHFLDFLNGLNEEWYGLLRHERFPYAGIEKLLGGGRLFDTALSFQAGSTAALGSARASFAGRWHYSGCQAQKLCLHLSSDGESLTLDVDYLTQVYDRKSATRIAESLFAILKDALERPDATLQSLRLMDEKQEEAALACAGAPLPRRAAETPGALLERVARTYPTRAAVIVDNRRTTYLDLIKNAQALAEQMKALVSGGEAVLSVELPRGAELFTALAAALLAPATFMIPDRAQPAARLQKIKERAGITLVMDENGLRAAEKTAEMSQPLPARDRAAYLVATSGSTGEPKLVEVGEEALVNCAAQMAGFYGRSAVLSLCNGAFDAFLIESVCAMLNGRTIVVASEEQMNDPDALAGLMRAYDAGFLAMTPSRMTAYLESERFRAALFHAESLVLGGERFPEPLLTRLKELTPARIYNQYGPSEATVFVSAKALGGEEQITCGRALPGCRIYVLDEGLHPVPEGASGEICIAGVCLAHGYRGNEQATAACFVSAPFEERLYKTGDIGRLTPTGELICMGRLDGQVKLNGRRVEIGEIEACLRQMPSVLDVCVTITDLGLTAYLAASLETDESEVRAFALSRLPSYMAPTACVFLPALPRTENGKVDRRALPVPLRRSGGEKPADELEQEVLDVFREALKRPELQVTDDYFLSGGDSLGALKILSRLREKLHAQLTVSALYEHGSARALAALVRGGAPRAKTAEAAIPHAPDSERYPLSPAQENFYALMLMDGAAAYNMPGAFRIEGALDEDRLFAALKKLVMLDEQFRLRFVRDGAGVAAVYEEKADFEPEQYAADTWREAFSSFVRPFKLDSAPLLRAAIHTGKTGEKTLFIDMPHIVSDGMSGELLMERLNLLYEGKEPELPSVRYRDYAVYASKKTADETALSYWRDALTDFPPPLELPFDYPEGAHARGASRAFSLPNELARKIDALAANAETTPFAVLCAAYMTLLSLLTGETDLCVGTPVAGRTGEMMRVSGAFVRTLPLRVKMQADFLSRARETGRASAGMIDHMDVRPAQLMRLAGCETDRPLYQTLFSLLPASPARFSVGDVSLTRLPFETGAVKAPLALETVRETGGYSCELAYDAERFDETTVAFIARAYQTLLENVCADPAMAPQMRDALPVADRVRLLDRPRRRMTPVDSATLLSLIEENAQLTPQALAVVTTSGSITYAKLIGRAHALAACLIQEGAQPQDNVGVLVKRDLDLLPTLLGVWAAGCAYVPLDATFPEERMRVMLERAHVSLVVVSNGAALPCGLPARAVTARFDAKKTALPPRCPDAAAYILFTSGSTGEPKGVAVPQRALSNLSAEADGLIGDCGTVLCATASVFDIFVTETWLPLALGRTVVMADDQQMLLPAQLAELADATHVDLIQLTPSRMRLCLISQAFRESLKTVRRVLLIGEELTLSLKNAITACTAARVINQYGPTEATVLCSYADVTDAKKRVTIGRPDANCRFYALDEKGEQVLPCAAGELYIAGRCLAQGYVGRDDLTEKAFVDDPFFPGEKMYRAGDMVRLLPDGEWAFLGRRDGQIKLDGHRIELSELESAALESGRAQEAAAVAIKKDQEVSALRLFVVPSPSYDEQALRGALAARLPAYMMPARVDTLAALPRTVSGKTDKNALAALPMEAAKAARTDAPNAPAPADDWMAALWRQALRTDSVAEDQDFFALGGTSLTALMIISEYFERGKRMTLEQFYHAPTLQKQRALLGEAALPAPRALAAQEKTQSPARALPRYTQQVKNPCDKRGDVLLTGASGFLGAHVLRELLAEGRFVVCLTRDEKRLRDTVGEYFGDRVWGFKAIAGDITKPRFGLPFREYADIALRTGAVIHCAADVRHYAADGMLRQTNVEGTRHVIDFCRDAEAALCHVSTASVCGHRAPQTVDFTEHDLYLGQDGLDNAYILSKLEAEALVTQAAADGLCAQIMRVGRLCARALDGRFQKNPDTNAFCRLVRGACALGALPQGLMDAQFDLTPVDACAQALVAGLSTDRAVLHLVSPRLFTVRALLDALGLESVPDERFEEMLTSALGANRSPYLSALADLWASRGQTGNVTFKLDETLAALKQAGFVWPSPPVERLIQSMKGE